jgi:tetratricopeptide (TPR) repeat protein
MTNDFKAQIKNARDERETGDATKALEMFLQIDKAQLEYGQLFDYLGELGLTYWHLKRFAEAQNVFEEALEHSKEIGNKSHQAMSLRQLSRPEFNASNPDIAVERAIQARQLALEEQREDLAWFDHGVVTALIFKKAATGEIKKWFDIEAEDLYKVSITTKDEIAKWVWFSGLLMDRSQVFDSLADLYLAMIIADQYGLARRKEQIKELIQKFNNK